MIWLLVTYLLLGGIGLSFWHTYRVLQNGRKAGAAVNEIMAARNEKRLFICGLACAGGYALTILLLSLLRPDTAPWIVLTPFLYLIIWSVPRLFLRQD